MLLKNIQYFIPNHIRRQGNEATDYFANWGYKNTDRSMEATPTDAI